MNDGNVALDFNAGSFEESISRAIVDALAEGMAPRDIIAQFIARGLLRDPGNNALEDVVRELADMADRLRSDPPIPTGDAVMATSRDKATK